MASLAVFTATLCGCWSLHASPCGKHDDPNVFLQKARAHARGLPDAKEVSAGYSAPKAGFIIAMVKAFEDGKISGELMEKASDREAARMITSLPGIGDWSAGGVLMNFLSRADVMLYGDLTIRNYVRRHILACTPVPAGITVLRPSPAAQ